MKHSKKAPEQIWIQGKINWFDSETGRGSILGNDGNMYRIQDFSSIERRDKLKPNALVTFKLTVSSINPIIEAVRPVMKEQQKSKSRVRNVLEKESAA